MITFTLINNGYIFSDNAQPIAIGEYSNEGFALLYENTLHMFGNACEAFTFLTSSLCNKPVTNPNTLSLIKFLNIKEPKHATIPC